MPIPFNHLTSFGLKVCDTNLGLAGIASHGVFAGDATWSVSEVTDSDSLYPKDGSTTKCFRARVTNPGTVTSSYQFDFNVAVVPNSFGSFLVPVKSNFSGGTPLTIVLLAETSAFANFWTYQYTHPTLTNAGEFYSPPLLRRSPIGTTGAPNANLSFQRIRIRVQITAGQTGEFIISPLYVRPETKTHVAIVFDDGWAEEFSNAYPYMQARGIPGSCAFLGSLQNGLTVPQALTMRDKGWSFHNHTFNHPTLTSLTNDEIRTQIESTRSVMKQSGLHDSGDLIFLPPQGARTDAIDLIINDYYPLIAWSNSGLMWGHSGRLRFTSDRPRGLARFNIDNPVTLNTAVSTLNSVIEQGGDLVFYGHKPIAGAAVGNLELSTLTSLVDVLHLYQQAGRIRVVNFQDLVRTLWDPRKSWVP